MRRRALFLMLFMPVYCAWPQVATGRTVRQLAADLRQNPNDQGLITKLGEEAGEEASVALAESFELASAKDAKQNIAWALVKRGSADSKYWEYLAAFARRAVESKVPYPLAYPSTSSQLLVSAEAERSRFSPSARAGQLQLALPEVPPDWRPRGASATS